MIQKLEEQKAKMKEKVNKEIDDYFTSLEIDAAQENFDINKLERLMVENHRKVKTALNESNSELASNVEARVKKTVQNAETP